MSFSTIQEKSKENLVTFPTQIKEHKPGDRVVTGDMHGNTLKYLHFPIKEDVINMTPEVFTQAANLYYNKKITEIAFIKQFQQCLDNIQVKTPGIKVMSIGDELYDRGKNDALSLLLFDKINSLGIAQTFIASNHSMEFIKCFSQGLATPFTGRYQKGQFTSMEGLQASLSKTPSNPTFNPFGSRANFPSLNPSSLSSSTSVMANTLRNQNSFKDDGLPVEMLEEIAQRVFIGKLKLLDYDKRESNDELIIYSHVPMTFQKIENLCDILQVEFTVDSIDDLKETIDNLNQVFSEKLINKNMIKSFFNKLRSKESVYEGTKEDVIFDQFFSDRYEHAGEENKINENEENTEVHPYILINVHGHVGEGACYEKELNRNDCSPFFIYCNIDTNLGKGDGNPAGKYYTWSTPNAIQALDEACKHHSLPMVSQLLDNQIKAPETGNEDQAKIVEIFNVYCDILVERQNNLSNPIKEIKLFIENSFTEYRDTSIAIIQCLREPQLYTAGADQIIDKLNNTLTSLVENNTSNTTLTEKLKKLQLEITSSHIASGLPFDNND